MAEKVVWTVLKNLLIALLALLVFLTALFFLPSSSTSRGGSAICM